MSARGRGFAGALLACLLTALAACGEGGSASRGAPVLDWYVGPDRADTEALAEACTTSSAGAYRIRVRQLPAAVGDRHAEVLRRLSAEDSSIDILSVDSAFTAELGAAQLLAPVPDDLALAYSEDVAPAALEASSHDGELVVAPWWFDPQLLWYRGNVAELAGLDTTRTVTWDDLLAGAERLGVGVHIDDRDGSGTADWVNALVAGAGGTLVGGAGRDAKVGLSGEAGRTAASIVEYYADSGVGIGPSGDAVERFAGVDGGFLLAPSSVISDPTLASVAGDLEWAAYPAVGDTSVAPLSGVGLGVPLYAPRSELSYDAITCLTSPTALASLMTSSGHSAARLSTYDVTGVEDAYPLAKVVRAALENGAHVPGTPYWQAVRTALDATWGSIADVSVADTPKASQAEVRAALRGRLP